MKGATIQVRLEVEQKAKIEAAARSLGLSVSAFVLSVALKEAGAWTLEKARAARKENG